ASNIKVYGSTPAKFSSNTINHETTQSTYEYLRKAGEGHFHGQPLRVLDMGCGKGGDLLKWRRGSITHLICADLAETSVEQCQTRYNDLKGRSRHERAFAPVFSAEFITADCTKVRLREKYKDVTLQLDLVSCQFVFHYSFESLPQAECMLRNASETLRPGGFFIGTIPDAYEIVSRAKKAGGRSFGNDLYRVEFEHDPCTRRMPLFGAKYGFHLEGVVDCPEFLVHFPTLERLAEKFGLELVFKKSFKDYYLQFKEEGRSLLGKMQALETYPPFHDSPLLSKDPDDYEHVQQYMQRSTGHRKVGTLSRAEWEAASSRVTGLGLDDVHSPGRTLCLDTGFAGRMGRGRKKVGESIPATLVVVGQGDIPAIIERERELSSTWSKEGTRHGWQQEHDLWSGTGNREGGLRGLSKCGGKTQGPNNEAQKTLYLVFAFRKRKVSWNAEGKPEYPPEPVKSATPKTS
ncbi:unnamed protein product, partial [Timema podura]|nr:unnamed protein product [Timema podura]